MQRDISDHRARLLVAEIASGRRASADICAARNVAAANDTEWNAHREQ